MGLASLPALALVVALLLGALVPPGTASAQTVVEPTPIEEAYLSATQPFRERIGVYQEQLAAHQRAASEGQVEGIDLMDIGDLTRELFAAQRTFEEASPSVRLDLYDRAIALALDRAYEATVLLLRAQRAENLPGREALIREAGVQSDSAIQLLQEAADELRTVFPARDS